MSSQQEAASHSQQRNMRQKRSAQELMMRSFSNSTCGRYDIAYVYANEAYEIAVGVPMTDKAIAAARDSRQAILHQLIPAAERWEKSKQSAEVRDENELSAAMSAWTDEEAEACTQWQWEVGQAKTASELILQSGSYGKEGRWDLAYVYANEAYEISSLLSRTRELIPSILFFRQTALSNLMPTARGLQKILQHEEREDKDLASKPHGIFNAFASNHSVHPPQVEFSSLCLFWEPASARMSCVLERQDRSAVEPAVGFFDLPEFFASHTAAGFTLENFSIQFNSSDVAVGEPPGEEHFRHLLELTTPKCRPIVLSEMSRVMIGGWPDFRNVTAATFKKFFGEVLIAQVYNFLDLRRLPEGVEPADFLLYPPLLASHLVKFCVTTPPPSHWPTMGRPRLNPLVVKFPIASILAHLKGKSEWAQAIANILSGGAASGSTANRWAQPHLLISDAYLADGEGGVEALVEAVKRDFLGEKEGGSTKKNFFSLFITYRHATAFDLRHCGDWRNSLGERLRVCATGESAMQMLDPGEHYHIEVRWTSGSE